MEGTAQHPSKSIDEFLESLNKDYEGYQEESRASIKSPYASLSIKRPKQKRKGAESFSAITDLFGGCRCIENLSTFQKVLSAIILILLVATLIVLFFVDASDEPSDSVEVEIRVDACAVNNELCLNEGICNSNHNSYTCTCADGFTGHNCEYSTCSAFKKSSLNLEVVSLDCGGLISIPNFHPSLSSFLLDYKGNMTYKNREQCLWTLNNTLAGMNYPLHMKFTLLCEGFAKSGGALSVIPWNHIRGDYILPYRELTPQNPNYESSSGDWDYKVFLNYASSDEFGSGFLVLVNVVRTIQSGLGSNFYFNASPGSQVYPTMRKNDHFSVVINPSENTTVFTVDYLDSGHTGQHVWIDKLDIYEIPPKSAPIRLARLVESFTTPRSFPFKHAMLATFQAWDTIKGNGFKFSWK